MASFFRLMLAATCCSLLCLSAAAVRSLKLSKPTAEANPKLDHVPFDPIVAEYEQEQDDHMWEHDYIRLHHEDVHVEKHDAKHAHDEHDGTIEEHVLEDEGEEEGSYGIPDDDDFDMSSLEQDYFDSDHFNMTERIKELFPLIDTHADHLITEDELMDWQLKQARRLSMHRSDRELDVTDKDGDGLVSLKEYLDENFPNGVDISGHEMGEDHKQTMTERFPIADADKDGKLNRQEFNDFLHPEDSDNNDLHRHTWRVEIRHRDHDKDGKLGFNDFFYNMYDEMVRYMGNEDEVEEAVVHHNDQHSKEAHGKVHHAIVQKKARAQEVFKELDTNKNGFLEEDEIAPVSYMIIPNEYHYSQDRTKDMIQQADLDGDEKLSLKEMLEHPYVFYGTMEKPDEDYHDEF